MLDLRGKTSVVASNDSFIWLPPILLAPALVTMFLHKWATF